MSQAPVISYAVPIVNLLVQEVRQHFRLLGNPAKKENCHFTQDQEQEICHQEIRVKVAVPSTQMKVVWEDHEAALETIALWPKALPQETSNEIADTIRPFQQKIFLPTRRKVFSPHQFCLSLPFQSWCYCKMLGVWSSVSRGCSVGLYLL